MNNDIQEQQWREDFRKLYAKASVMQLQNFIKKLLIKAYSKGKSDALREVEEKVI